jgi:hypothetical protein
MSEITTDSGGIEEQVRLSMMMYQRGEVDEAVEILDEYSASLAAVINMVTELQNMNKQTVDEVVKSCAKRVRSAIERLNEQRANCAQRINELR